MRRRMLKFASACPFRIRLWSSPNVTSSDQWQLVLDEPGTVPSKEQVV